MKEIPTCRCNKKQAQLGLLSFNGWRLRSRRRNTWYRSIRNILGVLRPCSDEDNKDGAEKLSFNGLSNQLDQKIGNHIYFVCRNWFEYFAHVLVHLFSM